MIFDLPDLDSVEFYSMFLRHVPRFLRGKSPPTTETMLMFLVKVGRSETDMCGTPPIILSVFRKAFRWHQSRLYQQLISSYVLKYLQQMYQIFVVGFRLSCTLFQQNSVFDVKCTLDIVGNGV